MTAEQLRVLALAALHKAKELKDQFGAAMPTDKMEQFNAHMTEFAQHNDAYEAAKKTQEQFAALDSAIESYTTPATAQIVHPASDLAGNVLPPAKKEAFRAAHKEAFVRYMKYGNQGLSQTELRHYIGGNLSIEELSGSPEAMELFAHMGTVDSLGGFLVPEDLSTELLKDLAGLTVMRSMSRIRQTSRSSASFLTVAGSGNSQYSSGVTGSFRSEGWVQGGNNIPTQNQPRFGRERVPVHVWSPDVIEITMELLEDSAVSLEAEVRALLAEVRANDEDSAFILGNGVGMPTGIHFEAASGNIATVNSGAAADFTYAGLVELWTALPAQYRANASYLLNSFSLGKIAILEDTAGNPIFPTNTIPTELFGRPLAVSEFMPDMAATTIPLIFGDFNYYGIADRMDLRIIRLNERFAPNIGLLAVARVGGQMLRNQPFVSQTISA